MSTNVPNAEQNTHVKTTLDTISETACNAAESAKAYATEQGPIAARHFVSEPAMDLLSLIKDYARDKPDVAACWCFGLGVLVGWKLKP